ncbi:hypothetical protein B6N60_03592 [Richelia sinica FACHB-800]|uniref:Uncharacterized protein n=1 Tax=Richelia sinica FACHB-800 TaxID=1357546 RepID=A0A975Y644_9NOST|nr:hypothetical protein [Richelia sinica]MBD2663987.1 hypothetical protein [Richelia sinica FACHB-800]QXE24882.1 hypothetical protein B6N60_03592 [Richelia sinica FACHB-800]
MPSVRLWVPESDYDSKAVCCIAKKIVAFYGRNDITIQFADKQGFNQAIHPKNKDGLKKAVNNYLNNNDLVIFLLDSDGTQSQAQRRREKNSLVNRIEEVVNSFEGRVKFFRMVEELEAWLLIDCLGICCYFTNNADNRDNQQWIKFANKRQHGQTDLIAEAESGGNGAKEYLEELSKEILIKKNPDFKDKPRNLEERKYRESQSSKIAEYIEINNQTLKKNKSLLEFAKCLEQLADSRQ